jgi:four helix bundle protein
MSVKTFEELKAWQKSKELSLLVYKLFYNCKDFKFRDQIQSASVSVMNNIAEGFERRSNKELIRFLFISKGSCGEVRSMLYLALELKYVPREKFDEVYNLAVECSRILAGLIKSL